MWGRLWSRSESEARGCEGNSEKWWLEVASLVHRAVLFPFGEVQGLGW